jgi:chromosome segregation ATPase
MRRKLLVVNSCRRISFACGVTVLAAAVGGQMSETHSIQTASRRLALALDALEAAAERRHETDRSEEALAVQIQALGADRARLASELDQASARSRGLETANREVAQRIAQAIKTIRGVLAQDQ